MRRTREKQGERAKFGLSPEVVRVLEGEEHVVKGAGEENFFLLPYRLFGWSNN